MKRFAHKFPRLFGSHQRVSLSFSPQNNSQLVLMKIALSSTKLHTVSIPRSDFCAHFPPPLQQQTKGLTASHCKFCDFPLETFVYIFIFFNVDKTSNKFVPAPKIPMRGSKRMPKFKNRRNWLVWRSNSSTTGCNRLFCLIHSQSNAFKMCGNLERGASAEERCKRTRTMSKISDNLDAMKNWSLQFVLCSTN